MNIEILSPTSRCHQHHCHLIQIFYEFRHRHKTFRFNGTFDRAISTSFIHDGVKMTEYENEPFIVGDYNHNHVEFMHLSHEMWYTASPFPHKQRVFGYAVVSRPGAVFLIGGCCDDSSTDKGSYDDGTIYLYENDQWEMMNVMKRPRINFMTITYGTDVMIIGGKTNNNQP